MLKDPNRAVLPVMLLLGWSYHYLNDLTVCRAIQETCDPWDILLERLPCSFRSCHFYGGVDKFLWLYLPILVLLLINTGMFIYVVFNICKTE